MDEVSQERVDDAWDEGFAHGYSRGKAENARLREENYDVTLTFLLSKEKADDEIVRLRNNQSILITSFRINMMRLCPDYSHEEFDKDIADMLKEKE
jgi:hypothetical protein